MEYRKFVNTIWLIEELRTSAKMARRDEEVVVWRKNGTFNTANILPDDIVLYDGRKRPGDEYGIYDPGAVDTDVVLLMALSLYQAAPDELIAYISDRRK